jgi:hypothetical protein
MLTTEDYRRLADRSARLAIACPAPSVAEALMALALDYMTQAARLGPAATATQQREQDPSDGFGD